ncbi:DoxX family protein [Chryseobacterium sp. Ch-15]|uniref:DoxX family protein n=1 Tax=Chryseobacterium muglaense TaxID=2893752 RepID=A0A9Q3UZ63_9FLAO|nr:DoxX family protein [Chryseobacterium muglaense]MBD3903400.1 DoxX family protein [Chryseobacterium muglaense]MCC9036300.1 DoxX family protein [Chryseobacterium muglaense]MCM2554821.1 DoxX family protein [Chryseobacterium muglaense]
MSVKNLTAKKIITIGLTALTTIMVGISGLMKAIHLPWSVEGLAKTNLPNSATALGLMEISFIILFVFPKTMRIGFLLISCYFAGAMGTELSHDGSIFNPAVPLILVWICAFLRDRSVFFGTAESTVN